MKNAKCKYVIIPINGNPQSGKDTVVDLADKFIATKVENAAVWNISSVDCIKKFIGKGETDAKPRKIIGEIKRRVLSHNSNFFLNALKDEIKLITMSSNLSGIGSGKYGSYSISEGNEFTYVIFYHERDPKLINKVIDYFDNMDNFTVTPLYIKRNSVEPKSSWDQTDFVNYSPREFKPTILHNNGDLGELECLVNAFIWGEL
ncbi:MAG: hypothetical protein OMM_00965 [Candidatus Magnetoglobus multicellularis str. Araruama]|uniref:Uncharacterized protein n=1 Tax=Candidatus Magnetoglobus multicellularis str. Araruama TaxID=890399 RepID=A0A1V1PEY8_9BACT|nr:MAG: hypothetical protein OMM_00965 [Candidatus Magnetoglobus multicellularis str. Araruama]